MMERKGKKRKQRFGEADQDVKEETKGPKIPRICAFTEVDFKVALRNPNSQFSGFEKFIEAANRWPGDAPYDIVEGFLRSSSECSEIFQILEAGKRKVKELQLIFQCFEKILLRIAEDLEKYHKTGQHIVRKLLTTQLPAVNFTLNTKHKSTQIKAALKLLVAMVMLGPSSGKTVLNQIDLNHATIKMLFHRRDSKDEEDVRTCLLHLLVAFLLVGDNELIRRLADTKGLLTNVFQGMVFDGVATIQLVLSTFLEKIIMNPVISKTSKVHIFTESSLKELGQLYSWKGPGKWKDKDHEKVQGEMEADTSDNEDRQTVAQTVHRFLLELCTSYKYGITFMDKTYGTSGRNQNHMLTSFLSYLSNLSQNVLVQELIVAILQASPDQLKHFLPHLAHTLSPRATSKWVGGVRFLCKIYEALPGEPHILKSKETVPMKKVLDILLVHTLPSTQIVNTIMPAIKNKSIAIFYTCLAVVKVIAQKCIGILQCLSSPNYAMREKYNCEELSNIAAAYREMVVKSLPDSVEIFHCLDLLLSEGQAQAGNLAERCAASVSDAMMRIEQVLCVYQTLHPTLLLDHPHELVKLLEVVTLNNGSHLVVGAQNEAEDGNEAEREKTLLPQLYLLKLLSGTDARRLPWGKEGHSGQTLMYQLLSMVMQVKQNVRIEEIVLQLICKLLYSTGVFDTFTSELYIWMRHVPPEASSVLMTFVSKVMMTYINNPYPYMDRTADLGSEIISMETGETAVDPGKETLDAKLEEILSMDLSCLEVEDCCSPSHLVARRHPFCPVLLVAIDQISALNMENIAEVKTYLSHVILDTFHSQVDPTALCHAVKKLPAGRLVDGLQEYITGWLPPYKLKKPKQALLSLPVKSQGHLMQYVLGGRTEMVEVVEFENSDLALTTTQCLLCVKLLLQQKLTKETRTKLKDIMECLAHLLSAENVLIVSDKDEKDSQLPSEFSELEVKRPTKIQELEAINRAILGNPTVRTWFLAEVSDSAGKQRDRLTSSSYTEIAKNVIIFIVNHAVLVRHLEKELGPYVDKILECISGQGEWSIHRSCDTVQLLGHMLDFLDTTKSMNILNYMLKDIERFSNMTNGSEILKALIHRLCNETVSSLELSKACINGLIKLVSSSKDIYLVKSVVLFFEKFQHLSGLSTNENMIELLQTQIDLTLVEIMIANSVEHKTYLERWFLSNTGWLTDNREKLLPLVEKLLGYQTKHSAIVGCIERSYQSDILTLCQTDKEISEDKSKAFGSLLQHFIRLHAIEKKTLKKLEKRLDTVLISDSQLQPHHVSMIQIIHGCQVTAAESQNQDGRRRLLRYCVQGMAKLLKEKTKKNHLVAKKILDLLESYSESEVQDIGRHWPWLTENWPELLKGCLKYLYTEPWALKLLTALLPVLYGSEQEVLDVTIETIVAMVTSHSSFLPIMFNEDCIKAKEPLLDLLICLVTLRPECCEKDHIGVYLGSYGATLSLADQKILKLMHLYEENGVKFSDFKPYLWGEKAVEHHTLRKSVGDTLLKQPSMIQVLANLQPDKVHRTILNFPVRRQLQVLETKEAEEYKSLPDCYDPCFLLPLFSHFLAPASIVDCRKFIESGCLGLVFSALSSHDLGMRQAACHVIQRYREHLEGARFMEVDQIKYILGLLKDSMSGSKVKLACIVTVFLARAVKVMLKPEDHMYGLINIFLLLKPSLDVGNVPEFYKLFNSSALEFRIERQWILTLLHDGLRETSDYRIFEKRYTFKLLQSFYSSDLSDIATKLKVLEILSSACRERTIAIDLVHKHGLLTWLVGVVHTVKPEAVGLITYLVKIVNFLWSSLSVKKSYLLTENVEDKKSDSVTGKEEAERKGELPDNKLLVQPMVTSQIMSVMQGLLWRLRDVEPDVLQLYIDTFSSVVEHLQSTAQFIEENREKLVMPTLSLVDILLLLLHSRKFSPSQISASVIVSLVTKMGHDSSLLTADKGGKFRERKKNSATEEIDEVESEERQENQDGRVRENQDGRVRESQGAVPELVGKGDTAVVDREESGTKPYLSGITVYIGQLLNIVKSYHPDTGDHSEEHTAALLTVILWCLQHLKHVNDVAVIRSLFHWLKSCFKTNKAIRKVITSDSELSRQIFTLQFSRGISPSEI